MSTVISLARQRSDLTTRLILASALRLLEDWTVGELTVRAVARQAGMSERTVFRYFADRDEFLDAVADEVRDRLELPPVPASIEAMIDAPDGLYRAFERKERLTKAALHSELFPRMRETQAKARWAAVRKLVDGYAPRRPDRERRIAAANIRYFLAATAWHYYRFYFRFSLEDSIDCARTAIRQSLQGLRKGQR
jgi:AcrR family transcriptional regulator